MSPSLPENQELSAAMSSDEMTLPRPQLLKLDKTVLVFLPDICPPVDELHIVNEKPEHRVAQVSLQVDGYNYYYIRRSIRPSDVLHKE